MSLWIYFPNLYSFYVLGWHGYHTSPIQGWWYSWELGSHRYWTIFRQLAGGAETSSKHHGTYRVSHGKVNKVIWLCWGYSFLFLQIFWVLWVHEKGTFMPSSSVFIFLVLRALYGSISQYFLFLNKFGIILTLGAFFKQ